MNERVSRSRRAAASDAARHMAPLEPRFAALWARCRLPGNDADATHDEAWRGLCAHYGAADRHYHSPRHVAFCLEEFDAARGLIAEPDAVEMALWFHDVVIVPGASDNEKRSAEYFHVLAASRLDPRFMHGVRRLIIATTHREAMQLHDDRFICDIDLASMGLPWPSFLADCEALRAESTASEFTYNTGKLRFYEALLARPSVFLTGFFRARREQAARENIERFRRILLAGRGR